MTARSTHVLVADHDDLMRASLAAALGRAGYAVTTAGDGDETLAILDGHEPDVVLMDSDLGPGPTGFEVLRVLRSRPEHRSTLVIVMVPEHEPGARVRALEAGATDYVVLPAALPELLARIRAQLDRRDQWTRVLEDRLAERQRLSQALADLPLHDGELLERQLRRLLGEHLHAIDVRLSPDVGAVAGVVDTRPVTAVVRGPERDGTRVRVPLQAGGDTAGILEVVVPGDGAAALASLTDLGPQLGALLRSRSGEAAATGLRRSLEARLRPGGMEAVYQPIVDLRTGAVVGHEGLTRFADGRAPDVVFGQARMHGLGREFEIAALEMLLHDAVALPPDTWLSVNLSADTFVHGDLAALASAPREVVVELTEHEHVEDYAALCARREALAPVRIAVDDLGSGYASLRHLLEVRPDFTKLDRDWIRGIAADPVRQALVGGVVGATGVSGAVVVGEGIETPAEARALTAQGVHLGQGWLFGRPAPAAASTRRRLVPV